MSHKSLLRLRVFLGAALVCCLMLRGYAQAPTDAWLDSQPRFCDIAADQAAVDRLLGALMQRYPDYPSRLRAVALLRLGTPYVLGCLGEESGRDTGPIFRLDESDCTVHVLTSTALAHSSTYDQARRLMTTLNYYPDAVQPIRYENRIHFTEDRLLTNPFYRIVATTAPFQTVSLILNSAHTVDVPWTRAVTLHYVALADVTPDVLAQLPPQVAGVAFVRRALFDSGEAVAHEGLIIDRRWLVHADSIGKKTSEVDFLDYLHLKADHFDGVIFYQIL